MQRALVVAGLALLLAAPLAAQDEGHRHFRYQVEAPHGNWSHMGREFGRMGRDWGRRGREYSRMGRDYARMYSRDWGRQWRGQEFGRQFRNFSGDMHRNWGRQWGRMGPNFQWRGYGSTPRRGEI
jgi:hypothetical protein